MRRLAEARWPELDAAGAPGNLLLVVPTGSCEQHGPHLPLDTDTRIATAFAEHLAARRSDVIVSPAISVGASGEHQSFPGTLSIGTDAMASVVTEVARSALPQARSGLPQPFGAVLFVNGHGGNVEALERSSKLLTAEGRKVGVWHPRVEGGDPHAGSTETSLMLHLCPDRVRMDLAEPGSTSRFSEIGDVLATDGLVAVTPNGVLGDPRTASAAQGAELFLKLSADLTTAADRLMS